MDQDKLEKCEVQAAKSVAIITARGGSKRIPGKNIRPFCGKPILVYSIEAALESGAFDEVMVSTDSDEIAAAAERYGAKVPFRRSAEMADDFATTDEVIAEVLEEYDHRIRKECSADIAGHSCGTDSCLCRAKDVDDSGNAAGGNVLSGEHAFQQFCCIYPTAPFLTAGRLREAMELLKEHESVLPVVRFSYPPQRGFVIRRAGQTSAGASNNISDRRVPGNSGSGSEAGVVVRWMPQYAAARSQDLEPVYHDAGQFYACRTDAFFRGRTTDVEDMVPVILPESEVQDIDTMADWEIAEEKFRHLHKTQKDENK